MLLKITVGFIYLREGSDDHGEKETPHIRREIKLPVSRCVEIWTHPHVTSYVDIENQFLSS